MLKVLTAECILFGFCGALYGWGRVLRDRLHLAKGTYAVTIVLGLGLWIFFGGVLNLVRLARAPVLDALVAGGLGLWIFFCWRDWRSRDTQLKVSTYRWVSEAGLIGFAALVMAFTIGTQLPPAVYNFHDDFDTYFVHPVKMLQTGTVYGSTLNTIGLQTLGGQAFLEGFVLAHFPIQYFNGVDAVFALLLCLLLAGSLGTRNARMAPALVLGPLLVVCIDPQYVNTSTLYTGAALLLGLTLTQSDPNQLGDRNLSAIVAGLLYAALLTLKTTFAPLVCLHFVLTFLSVCLVNHGLAAGRRWAGVALLAGMVSISPWVVLHCPHYFQAFGRPAIETAEISSARPDAMVNIFSTAPLYWGDSYAHYTGLVALILVYLVPALFVVKRSPAQAWRQAGATLVGGCLATVAAYLFALWVMSGRVLVPTDALRYVIPLLIAVTPAAVSVAILLCRQEGIGGKSNAFVWGLTATTLAVILSFSPSLVARVNQARHFGSILAFRKLATDADYRRYNDEVLYGRLKGLVATIQAKVPAGEPVLAWVDLPFYLDFKRNPITEVDLIGIAVPWATMPQAHYILWDYAGDAVRRVENYELMKGRLPQFTYARAKAFMSRLGTLALRSEILYRDDRRVLFRVPEGEPLQENF